MPSRITECWMDLSRAPEEYVRLWRGWGKPSAPQMLKLCAFEDRPFLCAWTLLETLSSEEAVTLAVEIAKHLPKDEELDKSLRSAEDWLALRKSDYDWYPRLAVLSKRPEAAHACLLLRTVWSAHNFMGDEWLCCSLLALDATRRRRMSWAEVTCIVAGWPVQGSRNKLNHKGKRRKRPWTN